MTLKEIYDFCVDVATAIFPKLLGAAVICIPFFLHSILRAINAQTKWLKEDEDINDIGHPK